LTRLRYIDILDYARLASADELLSAKIGYTDRLSWHAFTRADGLKTNTVRARAKLRGNRIGPLR